MAVTRQVASDEATWDVLAAGSTIVGLTRASIIRGVREGWLRPEDLVRAAQKQGLTGASETPSADREAGPIEDSWQLMTDALEGFDLDVLIDPQRGFAKYYGTIGGAAGVAILILYAAYDLYQTSPASALMLVVGAGGLLAVRFLPKTITSGATASVAGITLLTYLGAPVLIRLLHSVGLPQTSSKVVYILAGLAVLGFAHGIGYGIGWSLGSVVGRTRRDASRLPDTRMPVPTDVLRQP